MRVYINEKERMRERKRWKRVEVPTPRIVQNGACGRATLSKQRTTTSHKSIARKIMRDTSAGFDADG